jgi:DNA-binding NarL/FixJ family response regulator
MPKIPPRGPAQPLRTPSADWHAAFLTMLPSIQRHAERAFRCLPAHDREEAVQAVIAHSALAYLRLVELGKAELGYATPLARFAVRQHRAGRSVGSRANCRDVASTACQRRRGFSVESHGDWKLVLVEDRRTTPADLAALRVDFGDWLQTLSPRDRQVANALATGERTSAVARLFQLTAGRVSQLRRELYLSWQRFLGEPTAKVA